GLTIATLGEGTSHSKFAKESIEGLATQSPLTALNTAFAVDAVDIEIAADTVLNAPIYVAWLNTCHEINVYPRCLLSIGQNARATVIEHYLSKGPAFSNAITRIACDASAQLEYTKLQDEDPAAHHIASQRALLAADSRLELNHLDLGAEMARNDLSVELLGGGAAAATNGLFLADGERHLDNHVYLRHLSPHTSSTTNFRGVMSDSSKGVFNGSIFVEKDAQKTDAQLSNHNLLLSSLAEINTKPELEIYADDVKCAHGATTGRLDKNALFYLLARGIPYSQAEKMLIAAFAEAITSNINVDAVSERVHRAVNNRLGDREEAQ
ncbi:MAG: Fe-S cluster assembly protein SufD, partial [Gammaproteobacteria bacterium]